MFYLNIDQMVHGTWGIISRHEIYFEQQNVFDTTGAGNLTLTNDVVPSQTLGNNPIVMTNGNTALKVNHGDHGMHSTSNNVIISGVKSGAETTLNGAISDATTITLTSGTNFDDTSGKFSRTHQMFTLSRLVMRLFRTHQYQVM